MDSAFLGIRVTYKISFLHVRDGYLQKKCFWVIVLNDHNIVMHLSSYLLFIMCQFYDTRPTFRENCKQLYYISI